VWKKGVNLFTAPKRFIEAKKPRVCPKGTPENRRTGMEETENPDLAYVGVIHHLPELREQGSAAVNAIWWAV
jgi:hypothetical protein